MTYICSETVYELQKIFNILQTCTVIDAEHKLYIKYSALYHCQKRLCIVALTSSFFLTTIESTYFTHICSESYFHIGTHVRFSDARSRTLNTEFTDLKKHICLRKT